MQVILTKPEFDAIHRIVSARLEEAFLPEHLKAALEIYWAQFNSNDQVPTAFDLKSIADFSLAPEPTPAPTAKRGRK